MDDKETGRRLAQWRVDAEIGTQEDLAKLLGLSQSTIGKWERGLQPIPARNLKKLETLGFLTKSSQFSVLAPLPWVEMTYIGVVSASAKVDWTDPFESEDLVEVPTRISDTRGCFVCRCGSDSMMPLLREGNLLMFKASEFNQVGKIIVHRDGGGRLTIKQLSHDGQNYVLHPLNPKYEDEIADGCQLGYLVGVYADTYSIELSTGLSPKDFPIF